MKILSYNSQQGKLGFAFIESLLQRSNEAFLFQRFPLEWLSKINGFNQSYQPSFPGCAYGCVTLHHFSADSQRGYTQDVIFEENAQSAAYVSLALPQYNLVNTLPPFESGPTTIKHYLTHVEEIKKIFQTPSVVIGDFHFEDEEWPADFFAPFQNYADQPNFFDRRGSLSQLNKILSNFPLRMISETVMNLPKEPSKHLPIEWEFTHL